MGRRLSLILGVAAALLPASASADDDTEHNYQTWFAGFAHGQLRGNAWFWLDGHLRFYESFEPAAILLRPGFSWRAGEHVFLTAGYGWTPSFQREGGKLSFTDEHRAWQQIMWTPKNEAMGTGAILRGRLEQRFRPAVHGDTGLRGRVMWRGQVRLSKRKPVIFAMWDELFIGINDAQWGQRRGVDQNRVFVGIGWQIKPKTVRMEFGYTNVWLVRDGPDPVNHIFAINTFLGWPSKRPARPPPPAR